MPGASVVVARRCMQISRESVYCQEIGEIKALLASDPVSAPRACLSENMLMRLKLHTI